MYVSMGSTALPAPCDVKLCFWHTQIVANREYFKNFGCSETEFLAAQLKYFLGRGGPAQTLVDTFEHNKIREKL